MRGRGVYNVVSTLLRCFVIFMQPGSDLLPLDGGTVLVVNSYIKDVQIEKFSLVALTVFKGNSLLRSFGRLFSRRPIGLRLIYGNDRWELLDTTTLSFLSR